MFTSGSPFSITSGRSVSRHISACLALGAVVMGMASAHADPSAELNGEATLASARAQLAAGEFASAISLSNQMLSQLATRLTRYDPSLIAPLHTRAESLYQLGEYDSAIDSFMHSQRLLRMNSGLHTAEQIPLLHRLADSHRALKQVELANDYEEAAVETARKAFGAESPEFLAPNERLAQWYLKAGYPTAARERYRDALKITSANQATLPEQHADALKGIANTYISAAYPNFDRLESEYYARFTPTSKTANPNNIRGMKARVEVGQSVAFNDYRPGETALLDLIALRRDQYALDRSAKTQADLLDALLALGDWYVLFRDNRRAIKAFGEAERLMDQQTSQREFGRPKALYLPKPDPQRLRPGAALAAVDPDTNAPEEPPTEGAISLRLRIDKHGIVRRVTRLAASPEGIVSHRFVADVKRARYRPAFIDGEFASRDDVEAHFRMPFTTERSEIPIVFQAEQQFRTR